MQRGAGSRGRGLLAGWAFALTWLVVFCGGAAAQTTVVLNVPDTQVTDTTLRNGSHADANFDAERLKTRASTDPDSQRRSILKFDTKNTIPEDSQITSALLTLTVRSGYGTVGATRRVKAYRITNPFQADCATWNMRDIGKQWTTPGGDLAEEWATANVSNIAGTKVTFDVTALVQRAVNGDYSSRYTRVALVDVDPPTSASHREYHSSEATTADHRPQLVIIYGGSAPRPPPPPSTGSTLRVLQWNIAQGWGTDGRSNIDRVVDWVIRTQADVISFNEIMRYSSSNQCQMIADRLRARTGRTWYWHWVQKWGASSGEGEAVMSRFPFTSVGGRLLSYDRSVALASIVVNGRTVNVFATHLDHQYSSRRLTQVRQLKAWADDFAEQRIIPGDFNGGPTSSEILEMATHYYDAWAQARKAGTAIAYPDNPYGNTRNSRIDYVFYSKGASALVLRSAQVFDTRDSSGYRPSDHNPLLATFEVR